MDRIVSENGLTAFTERTITTISGLIEELRMVRRTGYALDEEELEPNVICYGAALRDGSGAVIGSISVSIPKSRASTQYRSHVARWVVKCARDITDRLAQEAEIGRLNLLLQRQVAALEAVLSQEKHKFPRGAAVDAALSVYR
jgi:hypothetical protein